MFFVVIAPKFACYPSWRANIGKTFQAEVNGAQSFGLLAHRHDGWR
jgi:hypothetical protein